MKKKLIYTTLLAGLFLLASAQSFTHQANIKDVKSAALHKIWLNPGLKRYMSRDLHDVRIYDSLNNEVPFVLVSEPLLKESQDFIPYEIVSQAHFKNYSEIVIRNTGKTKISNIAFNINNSDAHKYCSVEGSEDQKQWYSVSALQELSLAYNSNYTNSYKCVYFPLNDYLYFRLRVEDWRSEPLKINSAGYFQNSVLAGKLSEVKFTGNTLQDPKNKTTTIEMQFANPQTLNRIDFKIISPRLFLRHARVYANRTEKVLRKGTPDKYKTTTYKDVLFEFDLASDKPLFFDLPFLTEKELFLEIENKDSPPLVIESITCQQLATYLICDLDPKNKYTLKCGNMALKSPEYDLVNFVSVVPQVMPSASIENSTEIAVPKITVPEKEKSFFEKKYFLWICIGLGAVIVLFFSASLMKDMGKKNA